MGISLLEAISPTARELLGQNIYPVQYTWRKDGQERRAHSVIAGPDAETALKKFRRDFPHLTNATIIK